MKIMVVVFLLLHSIKGTRAINDEGDALHVFKDNLNDPTNVLQSWDPIQLQTPCTWFHVTCNDNNNVTRVDLGNAQLSGKIVPELGRLKSLQYLELYDNDINGTIPEELGNIGSLVSLDLYRNKLTGPIPDTLGKLRSLKFLRLNNNGLSGIIPGSLTELSELKTLDLSFNKLTGIALTNGSFSKFTALSFMNNSGLCYPKNNDDCIPV